MKECCVAEWLRLLNKSLARESSSSYMQYKSIVVVDVQGKAESIQKIGVKKISSFFREFVKVHFPTSRGGRRKVLSCISDIVHQCS